MRAQWMRVFRDDGETGPRRGSRDRETLRLQRELIDMEGFRRNSRSEPGTATFRKDGEAP